MRPFRFAPDGSLADAPELGEHRRRVVPLALELLRGFLGLEEPEEEHAERRVVADAPVGCRALQPVPDLVEPGVGQRVRLRVAGARVRLLDQAVVPKPRELGVDLAVARGPGVGERLLEVLEQLVARSRLVGEGAEEGVA